MPILSTLRTTALLALYPPSCAACDAPLPSESGLCLVCKESLMAIETACPVCARPCAGPIATICAGCKRSRSPLSTCTASFEYGGQLASALRRLKFGGRSDVAYALRPLLQDSFARTSARCDLAVAIPLHRSRLRQRGYNQAQRLLAPLARASRIREARQALFRHRPTPPQALLSRPARLANLRGAFRATPEVAGKSVLLVDDVRTTGTTLEEAARVLASAGAREIHGFVVARADSDG